MESCASRSQTSGNLDELYDMSIFFPSVSMCTYALLETLTILTRDRTIADWLASCGVKPKRERYISVREKDIPNQILFNYNCLSKS